MKEAHPDYDLIVIGGGCAGLSLARLLIENESTLRVLIPVSYTHLTLPTKRIV